MAKLKLCGMKRVADVSEAVNLKIDFIGLNFYTGSPRFISPADAQKLTDITQNTSTKVVGVFVNEPIANVNHICDALGIDIVQLHGDETPQYCAQLKRPYWKTFRIKNDFDFEQIRAYSTDTFLLDNYVKGEYGGTGRNFDWTILQRAPSDLRMVVAGGISQDNVGNLCKLKPYAIDVNSGSETSPGIKDFTIVKEIMRISRKYVTG